MLDTIIEKKKTEVMDLKKKGYQIFNQQHQPTHSLFHSLKHAHTLQVIAEIKRASPSKGDIKVEVDPPEQALAYERAGAVAISVLTDTPYFKGSIDDLANVRAAVNLPILCKDFMIDEIQIDRARDAGATVILLIVAALKLDRLQELYLYATERGLEVLVEVHNEDELKSALFIGAKIIGVNNRNLKTFKVDLAITETLGSFMKDKNIVFISESGIVNEADATRAAKAGAHGLLVGETLMKSDNVSSKLASLKVPKGVVK